MIDHATPRVGIATHNLHGLNFKDKKAGARLRKEANVKSLAHKFDVCLFQETLLGPKANSYLKRMLPDHGVFCSSLSFRSSGVATVVSPSLLTLYIPCQLDLPDALRGKALVLILKPRDGVGPNLVVVNLYLQTGDNYAVKKAQIDLLLPLIPSSPYIYVGGDFNFVEDKTRDTSSATDYYNPTEQFLSSWTDFKDTLGLREVFQSSHTHFGISREGRTCYSSRLDRIYVSLSEADWAAFRPFTYIPVIPHSLLGSGPLEADITVADVDRCAAGIPDHLPVGLSYAPIPGECKRDPSIPKWVADHPDFPKYFEVRWMDLVIHLDPDLPFDIHARMKACMFNASADVRRDLRQRSRDFGSNVAELTYLVKALRCFSNPNSPTSLAFFHGNPDLASPGKVRARINLLLSDAEVEADIPDRHPATTAPTNKALNKVKVTLPSTRTRLSALRQNMGADPTSDPDKMACLAATCWSDIWAKRKRTEECISPGDYYGDHFLTIPVDLLPTIPSVEQIEEAIARSGNSCVGPDGIPFAVWRAVKQHAAPVLHLVLTAICEGVLPPDGFNHGLLFLIPKNGTLLPSDTRPISVTNTDNRILAKATVAAITPALLFILHPSQKGFVKGRHFEEHIRDLNERFYEIVEGGDLDSNMFILFMDTAKAFDSIDHDFIFESIRRIGLPDWFSVLVSGLLHDVRVKPAFRGAKDHWIHIFRGVKQGCPLSPLLFIICYDVLLRRIGELPDADPFACADDLAVASTECTSLWPVMRLVDAFRGASGLGINTDKTRVLSALTFNLGRFLRPTTIIDRLCRCPWPDVQEALRYKYLGILIGRGVTTTDVYAAPTKALSDRATTYHSAFRTLSHASRVLAYNVFVITKLSYLVKFFHIPFSQSPTACAEGVVKARARQLILPVRAAYHYPFLVVSPDLASPAPPVRDAWALSMSTLIDQSDLWEWHGQGATDGSVITYPEDRDSMRISRHIRSATTDFVCRITAATDAAFDASPFDCETGAARRQKIYQTLIKIDYKKDIDNALSGVLTARGLSLPDQLVPVLHANFSLLPKQFPPHLRCSQFEIITNCLFDSRRFNKIDGHTPSTCFLCGRGADSVYHLYGGECEVVVGARSIIPLTLKRYAASGPGFPSLDPGALEASDFWASSLLAFPRPGRDLPAKQRKEAVFAMALFNGVLWYERTYHFCLLTTPPQLPQAIDRLASMVAIDFHRLRPGQAAKGGAAARKQARKEVARAFAKKAIHSLPPQTLVAFTDGSANPNPGPSGAGAFLYGTSPGDSCHLEATAALGEGTNNLGELWAIGMAAQMALTHISSHIHNTYTHFQLYTDSMWARACVLGEWKSTKYRALVEAVAHALHHLSAFVIVSVDWVPAHVGIDANEHADFLAGRGTLLSQAGRVNVDAAEDFKTGAFVPSAAFA